MPVAPPKDHFHLLYHLSHHLLHWSFVFNYLLQNTIVIHFLIYRINRASIHMSFPDAMMTQTKICGHWGPLLDILGHQNFKWVLYLQVSSLQMERHPDYINGYFFSFKRDAYAEDLRPVESPVRIEEESLLDKLPHPAPEEYPAEQVKRRFFQSSRKPSQVRSHCTNWRKYSLYIIIILCLDWF